MRNLWQSINVNISIQIYGYSYTGNSVTTMSASITIELSMYFLNINNMKINWFNGFCNALSQIYL